MPKVRRSRKPPPDGWELIEPTLDELDQKMREGNFDLTFDCNHCGFVSEAALFRNRSFLSLLVSQLRQNPMKENERRSRCGRYLGMYVYFMLCLVWSFVYFGLRFKLTISLMFVKLLLQNPSSEVSLRLWSVLQKKSNQQRYKPVLVLHKYMYPVTRSCLNYTRFYITVYWHSQFSDEGKVLPRCGVCVVAPCSFTITKLHVCAES